VDALRRRRRTGFRQEVADLDTVCRAGPPSCTVEEQELAQRLRGLDVSTPIVLITGYPDEHIQAKASSAGVRQVLLKPNLEDNLVECVRNAIDTRSAASQP